MKNTYIKGLTLNKLSKRKKSIGKNLLINIIVIFTFVGCSSNKVNLGEKGIQEQKEIQQEKQAATQITTNDNENSISKSKDKFLEAASIANLPSSYTNIPNGYGEDVRTYNDTFIYTSIKIEQPDKAEIILKPVTPVVGLQAQCGTAVIEISSLTSRTIAKAKEPPDNYKGYKLFRVYRTNYEDTMWLKYGCHNYAINNQKEYDSFIGKIDAAVANAPDVDKWITMYLDGKRHSEYKEGSSEYNKLLIIDKKFGKLFSQISKEDAIKYIKGISLIASLQNGIKSPLSAAYEELKRSTYLSKEIAISHLSSAVWDSFGFNTTIESALFITCVELNGTWWNPKGESVKLSRVLTLSIPTYEFSFIKN